MKLRDKLTLVAAFCGTMGGPMMALGEGKLVWWTGLVMTSLGSTGIAARALLHGGENNGS